MIRLTSSFLESLDYSNPKLQKMYTENLSTYYFPGDLTAFYFNAVERHSTDNIICHFSGSIIKKGTLYISYRPLIENLKTGQAFVLKRTIKCEIGYLSYLPNNIMELEYMNYKIMDHENVDKIEYNNLYNYQNGELMLQKLNKLKRSNNGKRK